MPVLERSESTQSRPAGGATAPSDDAGFTPASVVEWERDGAVRHPGAAAPLLPVLDALAAAQPQLRAGARLHGVAGFAVLVASGPIQGVAATHIGPPARPVRAILFDKTPAAKWSLGWHQDRSIAVRERHDLPGYAPWTTKQGILHVAPPFAVIAGMATLRIHLDDVPADNAPLLIAPGSHRALVPDGDRRRGRALRHPRLPRATRRRLGLFHPDPPRFRHRNRRSPPPGSSGRLCRRPARSAAGVARRLTRRRGSRHPASRRRAEDGRDRSSRRALNDPPAPAPLIEGTLMSPTAPNHPGNEPDPGDMAVDPSEGVPPPGPDLPEEEAEALGDFA